VQCEYELAALHRHRRRRQHAALSGRQDVGKLALAVENGKVVTVEKS
jgi:hypothetical protein